MSLEFTESLKEEQFRTSQMWDEIYSQRDGKRFPHEQLIKFIFFLQQYKDFDELSALDIGFGTFANLKGCFDLNYDISGIEVSDHAVQKTAMYFNGHNIPFEGKVFETPAIPFADNKFTLVYSNQSIYYNIQLENLIQETWRVLKPGGAFYHTFFSPQHWYFKHSKKIDDQLVMWDESHPSAPLRGMTLRYFDDKSTLKTVFKDFVNVRVDELNTNLLGIDFGLWIVTGFKDSSDLRNFSLSEHYSKLGDLQNVGLPTK